MRCQVVSLQEKPWCTSFRRHVNKHSEEESKFIWLTFGICKVGLKFLENETFESYTLCHHQELARGALKQCRETWASSLPFLPTSRSAAALAEPHIVRSAWESSIFLALVDWGRTCCRMTWTAMTQTTRWSVSFLTLPRMGIRLRSQVWNASYLDQSMLDLAFCSRWSCPPPALAPWKLEGQGRLCLGKPQLCQAQLVCEEKGDCQGEARLWTRTLVCDGLDAFTEFFLLCS